MNGLGVIAQILDHLAVLQNVAQPPVADVADRDRDTDTGHDIASRIDQAGEQMAQALVADQRGLRIPIDAELGAVELGDLIKDFFEFARLQLQLVAVAGTLFHRIDPFEIGFDIAFPRPFPQFHCLVPVLAAEDAADAQASRLGRIPGRHQVAQGIADDPVRPLETGQGILDRRIE